MNKEEKETIKELKEEINKPVELPEDKFDTFILFNIKSAKTVLNYIEKLQKENEELKEEIKKQYKQYIKDHTEVIENLKKDSISKDIIRDKIKELDTETGIGFELDKDEINGARVVLKELLGE